MIELTMNLPEEKIGWVSLVEDNIDVNETLYIHVHGILSREKEGLNSILLEFPEKLKLKKNSKIKRLEYENHRFIGRIETLPQWKRIHRKEKTIVVDFMAEVTDYNGTSITILLPDSYIQDEETTEDNDTITQTQTDCSGEKVNAFASIDFETIQAVATDGKKYNHLPVSVGIVKVINGTIVQKFHSLIKPPVEGEWVGVKSGITDNDCMHAPSYEVLFPIINELLGCYQLVSYGHGTEKSVLNEMEKFYHLEHRCLFKNQIICSGGEQFIDPLEILKSRGEKNNSLGNACERYGIHLDNAHNSLSDAEATALLLLKLQGVRSEIKLTSKNSYKDYIGRPKKDKSFFNKELPIEKVTNPGNPFFRKKICCTGFPIDVADDVNKKMYLLGAIVKGDVSATQTDLLILGPEAGRSTSKIAKAKEWNKTIMSLEELKSILEKEGELDDLISSL